MHGVGQMLVQWRWEWNVAGAACLAVILWLWGGVPAWAATYQVDTTSDNATLTACSTNANDCSLRGAIIKSNTTAGGPHTILVPAGDFLVSGGPNENSAVSGDLDILASVTIIGSGVGKTIIGGVGGATLSDRVLEVISGTLELRDLAVLNGRIDGNGGGLRVAPGASATLLRVVFEGNVAESPAAAIREGGGVRNEGTLTIDRAAFVLNGTLNTNFGGAISSSDTGTMTLSNVTFFDNKALSGGSAIRNRGQATGTNLTIAGNAGPAPANSTNAAAGVSSVAGLFTIRNSILVQNTTLGATDNCQVQAGALASAGHNLTDTPISDCGFASTGDLLSQNASLVLGPLALDAGLMKVRPLLSGSPALDAGDPGAPGTGGTTCAALDARGLGRPQDGAPGGPVICDIGAWEMPGPLAVDRTDDDGSIHACTAAPNDCTLRGAISVANNAGTGVISVQSGTYTLTQTGAGEDFNESGDLDIRSTMALNGAGADLTIIQAAATPGTATDRVFHAIQGAVSLTGMTVQYGVAPSGNGGGLLLDAAASGNLADVFITQNQANVGGGGGVFAAGAFVFNGGAVSGNLANPAIIAGKGGGLRLSVNSTITNVSLAGNLANSGAGIASAGVTTLNNVSIADHATAWALLAESGQLTIANSIVTRNQGNCLIVSGVTLASSFNLTDNAFPCPFSGTGDQTVPNAILTPLQDNGGKHPSLLPLPGSPAIDTGNPGPGGTQCAPNDQRGLPRPLNGDGVGAVRCDQGAVETCPPGPPFQMAVTPGPVGQLTVSLTSGLGAIQQIQFQGVSNPNVPNPNVGLSIGGQSFPLSGLYRPPAPTGNVQFQLQRIGGAGTGMTLPFTVRSQCGTQAKFAGAGTGTWGGNAPSASLSVQAPSAPVTTMPVPAVPTMPAVPPVPGAACAKFPTHAAAQAFLRADPRDPLLLDKSRNGIACEGADGAGFVNPPLDQLPVPRP